MTQKGQSGKAVGAAVLCSAIGGIASALVMMAATEPLANWAIRNIGPPKSLRLSSLVLWLPPLLARAPFGKVDVGPDRFVDRNDWPRSRGRHQPLQFRYDRFGRGHCVYPAILGFFAVSEIFVQAEKKASGKYQAPKVSMTFPSFIELWMHKIAVLRSILVGFLRHSAGYWRHIGAFMSYGEAVRWSKNREEFGKGKLEGVISAETANNAATGAAMIPLLALGLPGAH